MKSFSFILSILLGITSVFSQIKKCDLIPITIRSRFVEGPEVPSLICGGKVFYDVVFLLNELKIQAQYDNGILKGRLGTNNLTYSLDFNQQLARVENEELRLDQHLRKFTDRYYLEATYLEKIFGLSLAYNASELSADLSSQYELPVVRLREYEKNRQHRLGSLLREGGELEHAPGKRRMLGLGELTWDVFHTQWESGSKSTRLSIGVGGNLLGGEFIAGFNHGLNTSFKWKNQFYRWRWVDNHTNYFNQLILGRIPNTFIADILSPMNGIHINNQKSFRDRIYSYYSINEMADPGWTVEVYVNSQLIDYVRVEKNGQVFFKVPIFYGNNIIELKYYSPWGEVKTETRELFIPSFLVEKGEFQYTASAALISNGEGGRVANFNSAYGLSNDISIIAGIEYLKRRPNERDMVPFLGTSVRLPYNFILSHKQLLNFGHETDLLFNRNNFQLDIGYSYYTPGHLFLRQRYNERFEAGISFPWHLNDLRGSSFLRISSNRLGALKFTQLQWQLSVNLKNIPLHIDNQAIFYPDASSVYFSRIQSFIQLSKKLFWRPELSINTQPLALRRVRNELNYSPFPNSLLSVGYDRYFKNNVNQFNLGFRWNLNFANTGINLISTEDKVMYNQFANGSILVDRRTKNLHAKNFNTIGFNSVKFLCFLDENSNGELDPSEEILPEVDVDIKTTGVKNNLSSGILYTSLEPFRLHEFAIDEASINRMDWKARNPRFSIWFNSNEYQVKYLPIIRVAEILGRVVQDGIGKENIVLEIRNMGTGKTYRVTTYTNGQFNFLGLERGHYEIRALGPHELKVNYNFEIRNENHGEILDDLLLTLKS